MAHVNPGVAPQDGIEPASVGSHDHGDGHAHSHSHAHRHGATVHDAPRDAAIPLPRAYKHSMFLASAIERLVIAVLLIGLIWLGIFWAVS